MTEPPTITTADVDERVRAQEILDRAKQNLPKNIELYFVEYDDRLRGDQIAKLFASEDGENDIWDELSELWADQYYANQIEYAQQAVDDEDDWEILEQFDDLLDELRYAVQDADKSNPIRDLARNSTVLMRYRVGDPNEDLDLTPDSWAFTKTERYREARHLGSVFKLDWATWKEKLYSLVDEASYGGVCYVIFQANVGDLLDAVNERRRVGRTNGGTITFEDPYLLVLDRWNGSGFDVKLKGGKVSYPFDYTRLVSDDGDFGYGWDNIAGLVKGAYATDFTISSITKKESA